MTDLQRINACAKRPIDVWTNYLYYPLSIRLVYLLRNTRVTPNAITLFSLFLALAGCLGYADGHRRYVVIGLILVQISYVFDCADGQLARFRQQFSPVGGWIDQVADRIKEFAVYFSLAFGYTRIHPGDTVIWQWGTAALFALYLLEYYGQIRMKPLKEPAPPQPGSGAPASKAELAAGERDTFTTLQRWRSFVPFRGFIIGEQYFAMLVFVGLNAIYPFFVFVALLGLAMAIYRPVIQFIKLRRAAA